MLKLEYEKGWQEGELGPLAVGKEHFVLFSASDSWSKLFRCLFLNPIKFLNQLPQNVGF